MCEMSEPFRFQARMIEENHPAFNLWRRVCSNMEEAIVRPRNIQPAFPRALDLLFIQAFKSFSSLYVLCVRGLDEDAATILRRLLEITMQAKFLAQEPREREHRGARYLAYFWGQVPMRVELGLAPARRHWWEEMLKRHKSNLSFGRRGQVQKWWGGSIGDLFTTLGRKDTYDQDYSLLSQMTHGTSQGILLDVRGDRIEILSSRMVPEILVFGCRYVLLVAHLWNEHFNLMEMQALSSLMEEALAFKFGSGEAVGRSDQ